jgi:ankyrin repeat protein
VKTGLAIVAGLLSLSCLVVVGPWVLIAILWELDKANKERELRHYQPTSLADAVGYKYTTPAMVASFIDQGGDVNQRVPYPTRPPVPLVQHAALLGNLEVTQLLLHRGAHVDEAGLWWCARLGQEAMARMLISEHASLGRQQHFEKEIGPELLQAAVAGQQAWLVRQLLDSHADPHMRNERGEGLLSVVFKTEKAQNEDTVPMVRLLLAAGVDPALADDYGDTPVHWAAREGTVESLRVLLDAGAPVDGTAKAPTPLTWAVEFCQYDTAALLLQRGASRTARMRDGKSMVEGACPAAYDDVKPARERMRVLLASASGH